MPPKVNLNVHGLGLMDVTQEENENDQENTHECYEESQPSRVLTHNEIMAPLRSILPTRPNQPAIRSKSAIFVIEKSLNNNMQ